MRTSDKKLHEALDRKIVESYRKIDRKKSRIDEAVDLSAAKTLKEAINTAKIIIKKIESAGKFFQSDAIMKAIEGIKKELVEFTVQGLGKSEKQNVQIFKKVMLISRELAEINNAIYQMIVGISNILETAEIEIEPIKEKTLSSILETESDSELKGFFENAAKFKEALVKSIKSPKKKDKNASFFEKFFGIDKKESLDIKKMVDEVVDKAEIKNLNLWLEDANFDEIQEKIRQDSEKMAADAKKAKEDATETEKSDDGKEEKGEDSLSKLLFVAKDPEDSSKGFSFRQKMEPGSKASDIAMNLNNLVDAGTRGSWPKTKDKPNAANRKEFLKTLQKLKKGLESVKLESRLAKKENDNIIFENKKQQKGDTMKLTETMLRKMIQEERRNLQSKRKPINESFQAATEMLYRAMEAFIEEHMNEYDHEDSRRACNKLKEEVLGFCEGFIGEFQDDEY